MPNYVAGLDLGQSADYTALVVVEHLQLAKETPAQRRVYDRCDVVHVERFSLGTPYPAIVEQVVHLIRTEPLWGQTYLLIDATGVGRGVMDLFREAHREGLLDRFPYPLTITGGEHAGNGTVPKQDLVSTLQALSQTGRIRIPPSLPLADVLRKELLGFSAKVSRSGRDTYEALTESVHDDLVIALAFACWFSPRKEQRRYVARDGQVYASFDVSPDPY